MYVQYGSGLSAPTTWRNFDASPSLRLQKLSGVGFFFRRFLPPLFPKNTEYGDILKGLPVPSKSCNGLYCSHVLEHLSLQDFRVAVRNSHALLRDGGIFRFVLPDLETIAGAYLSSAAPDACSQFMEASLLGSVERTRGLVGFLRQWLGNSAHLWMWDFKGISAELSNAGFRGVRRAEFADSDDKRFADVEDADRWRECLGVECRK
ncbi:MAG: hypothetical protein A2Y78_10540 [Acidobacteria bacterium RBG_13_68_16]|nr:MAG: hypothetical protein A2Y78_10540 [Acidobacteria bacterium RBG_13_68_16]